MSNFGPENIDLMGTNEGDLWVVCDCGESIHDGFGTTWAELERLVSAHVVSHGGNTDV